MTIRWRRFSSVRGKSWSYVRRKRMVCRRMSFVCDWSISQTFSPLFAPVFYVPWVSSTLLFYASRWSVFISRWRCLWWKIRRRIRSDVRFTVIFFLIISSKSEPLSLGTLWLQAAARMRKSFSSVWQHEYFIGSHAKSRGRIMLKKLAFVRPFMSSIDSFSSFLSFSFF